MKKFSKLEETYEKNWKIIDMLTVLPFGSISEKKLKYLMEKPLNLVGIRIKM